MLSQKNQIKSITDFISTSILNEPIDVSTFESILQKHPNYASKTENIDYWFVGLTAFNKKGLFIMKKDGTTDGFSYRVCVTGIKPKEDFNSALRNEIYQQISDYKSTVDSIFTCVLCNNECNKSDCHIDHIKHFYTIAAEWCKAMNVDETQKLIHNGPIITLDNRELATSWYNYHKTHAELRPLCSACNLKRGKKAA